MSASPIIANVSALGYLVSAVFFILSIRGLAHPESARSGLKLGVTGMALAIGITLILLRNYLDHTTMIMIGTAFLLGGSIGSLMAFTASMTAMPQMVSLLNGLGGLASLLIALAAAYAPDSFSLLDADGNIPLRSNIEISLSVVIGAVTFSGSLMAAMKLQGWLGMVFAPFRHGINAVLALFILSLILIFALAGGNIWLILAALLSLSLGILLVLPIGGADMPVIISMLNSYSGWAAAALGMTLANFALIVVGAIVGASGAILSYIMCKAMNRSFLAVISGGFGTPEKLAPAPDIDKPIRTGSAEDAAFTLKNASKVIIVPGYGMAVAQAQHAVKEMADNLKNNGISISYAIHPVAGRMPGHMNVLLAEAQIDYDEIFAMEDINPAFKQADVAFIIGANDVTNPAAKDNPASPIYGMPVLEVWNASTTMFVKRSTGTGYAGIPNELFYRDNTMMLLDDGRKMVEKIARAL